MNEDRERTPPALAANTQAPSLSADERRAKGKALRAKVPRSAQAGWKAPKGRRDPLEILRASNAGRVEELVPIRFGRMSASPFAFYRGSAALMASDLATTPTSGLRVQACGDAHLMNFGGVATPERNVIFDVNDLDETLPAPFEWDVKRLAASAHALARAHARSGDAATIAGYMGSGHTFDDAIGQFAVEYADQNGEDYRAFMEAIRDGRIEATVEAAA
ncbi:MAG: DUF2252 family protein [Burkholderiales bacterium]